MSSDHEAESRHPIEKAILSRDVSAVRGLIEAGTDVDQKLWMGNTPAFKAATADTWDIVLYLLKQGADPAWQNWRGNSIADFARTSRVHPENKEGRALEEVRGILTERGLY